MAQDNTTHCHTTGIDENQLRDSTDVIEQSPNADVHGEELIKNNDMGTIVNHNTHQIDDGEGSHNEGIPLRRLNREYGPTLFAN